MKLKYFCPICGTRELAKLIITTQKGKSLSLLVSSQANIRKSCGDVCCLICKHVWRIDDFHKLTKCQVDQLDKLSHGQEDLVGFKLYLFKNI